MRRNFSNRLNEFSFRHIRTKVSLCSLIVFIFFIFLCFVQKSHANSIVGDFIDGIKLCENKYIKPYRNMLFLTDGATKKFIKEYKNCFQVYEKVARNAMKQNLNFQEKKKIYEYLSYAYEQYPITPPILTVSTNLDSCWGENQSSCRNDFPYFLLYDFKLKQNDNTVSIQCTINANIKFYVSKEAYGNKELDTSAVREFVPPCLSPPTDDCGRLLYIDDLTLYHKLTQMDDAFSKHLLSEINKSFMGNIEIYLSGYNYSGKQITSVTLELNSVNDVLLKYPEKLFHGIELKSSMDNIESVKKADDIGIMILFSGYRWIK